MSKNKSPELRPALFHPRYWLTWVLFGLWWLFAQLPFRVQLAAGNTLGLAMYYLARRRRHIAKRNLELCFPELNPKELETLLKNNFKSTAIGFFETGMAWFWSRKRLARLVKVEGVEHIKPYLDNHQGFLFLVLHFTTLEMMGVFMNNVIDTIDMTYRPHANPVYDYIQSRGRARHNPTSTVVARDDVRGMVKSLKKGRCISYFPDQDYGAKHSVFAPFFGIPAATVTALSRLAKMADVPVVPISITRLPNGKGYDIKILPAWENYPSGDELEDAVRLNKHVETQIQQCPEQYLWVHRRFKSRPVGMKNVY